MLRRARRQIPLIACLIIFSTTNSARADKVGFQGTFSGDTAWTDNVMNSPKPSQRTALLNLVPPVADFFFELRPGFILSSNAPRAVTSTQYFFQADLFATHSEGNSYSNTLSWSGFFLPSPRSEMLFSVLGQQGRLNTFNLTEPSTSSAVGVIAAQASSTSFAQVSASETLLLHLPQNWTFTQSVTGRAWFDLQPGLLPNVYEGVAAFGADHRWKIDAIGFNLRLDLADYDAVRSATTDAITAPAQIQLLNRLVIRWRRDWTNFWNTELDAGVVEGNGFGASGGVIIWQPAALAALRYNHRRGSAELLYQHEVQPNAVAASTFAVDEASLRGTLPFPERSHLYFSTTLAYQHARQIDFATGLTQSSAEIIVVDATLRWQPRTEVGLFARFSYFDQIGHDTDAVPQLDIERAVAMIGIDVTYPGVPISRVPSQRSVTEGRVDRGDVEMIPEPHSPAVPQQ